VWIVTGAVCSAMCHDEDSRQLTGFCIGAVLCSLEVNMRSVPDAFVAARLTPREAVIVARYVPIIC
jgi:hypothetical protein